MTDKSCILDSRSDTNAAIVGATNAATDNQAVPVAPSSHVPIFASASSCGSVAMIYLLIVLAALVLTVTKKARALALAVR